MPGTRTRNGVMMFWPPSQTIDTDGCITAVAVDVAVAPPLKMIQVLCTQVHNTNMMEASRTFVVHESLESLVIVLPIP